MLNFQSASCALKQAEFLNEGFTRLPGRELGLTEWDWATFEEGWSELQWHTVEQEYEFDPIWYQAHLAEPNAPDTVEVLRSEKVRDILSQLTCSSELQFRGALAFNLTQYQAIGRHNHDERFEPEMLVVVFQIPSEFEGGELQLHPYSGVPPITFDYSPESVTIFKDSMDHEVLEVLSGNRRSVGAVYSETW